jgi:outer membrane protease
MNRLSCTLAVSIVFIAVSAPQARAEDSVEAPNDPWSVDFRFRNYFSSHTSYEFGNPLPPNQEPLSRLEFPLNSWWAGVEVRRRFSRFSVGLEAMRNVSGEASGRMKDSDWEDENQPGLLTTYSASRERIAPSYTVRGDVDLKVSDGVGLPSGFDLRPVLGFRWQHFSFVTHDGLQSYPAPEADRPPDPLPGDGIGFKQTYWHAFLGVKLAYEWESPPYVSMLGVRMQLDGAYVTGDNVDHHLLRDGQRFTYENTQGTGWHASLGLDVGLTPQLTGTIDMDYLRLSTTGSHRLVNSLFDVDLTFNNGVKVRSRQASLTLGLRYAF